MYFYPNQVIYQMVHLQPGPAVKASGLVWATDWAHRDPSPFATRRKNGVCNVELYLYVILRIIWIIEIQINIKIDLAFRISNLKWQ